MKKTILGIFLLGMTGAAYAVPANGLFYYSSGTFWMGSTGDSIEIASANVNTVLNVPKGTNPDMVTTGNIAVDTSSNQVVANNGFKTVVLKWRDSKTFNLDAPAAGDQSMGFYAGYDLTVSSVIFISSSPTGGVVSLLDCAGSGGTSCNTLVPSVTISTNQVTVLISSNVAVGRRIRTRIESVSGTPGQFGVDVFWEETRK